MSFSSRIVILVVPLALALVAPAHADASSFVDASHDLAAGHCAKAATGFEADLKERGWSVATLYDLGNAYACDGKPGRAVLSYERARLLAPRAADVSTKLSAVRGANGIAVPSLPWYLSLPKRASVHTLAWGAVAALWLGIGGLVFATRRRLRACAAVLTVIGLLTSGAAWMAGRQAADGIVVAAGSAPLRLSPFDTAAIEGTAREGERVRVLDRHGSYVRVRNGEGHAGWMSAESVEAIAPRGV